MMQPSRNELIDKLLALSDLSTDVRFGQLLANLGLLVEDQTDRSLWDVGDEELLRVMEAHRSDLLRRQKAGA